MGTSTEPTNAPSLVLQPDLYAPNPLYPFILATVFAVQHLDNDRYRCSPDYKTIGLEFWR